jgi:hypothetical protein
VERVEAPSALSCFLKGRPGAVFSEGWAWYSGEICFTRSQVRSSLFHIPQTSLMWKEASVIESAPLAVSCFLNIVSQA